MNPRAVGILFLVLLGLPVVVIGPEQYGYAFLGILAGLGGFAGLAGAESPVWMIVLPVLTIAAMVLFCAAALAATGYALVLALGNPRTSFKLAGIIPLVFALLVIAGLALLEAFPGRPAAHVSWTLYGFPCALAIASLAHAGIKCQRGS